MGGGPPASRPRRELCSARRLEARPGPATAHGHRSLARGRCDPDLPRTSSCLPSITVEAATSWLPKNVARNSPAISSNFEFMSLELQRFWVVSKNDRGKLRAKFVWARPAALRGVRCRCDNAWPAGDTTPIRPARPLDCLQSLSKRLHRGCPKMLHVIPLRLFQILNSRRWNCNVFGWSRKMTEGNYVRHLSGPGLPPSGAVAWPAGDATPICPARPLACLQSLLKRLHRGCLKMLHVIPLRLVQILNSCRWNCNVFGWSRKMTEGNYVRNLAGGAAATGTATRNMGATAGPAPLRSPPRRWWWGFAALGAGCRRVAGVLYL